MGARQQLTFFTHQHGLFVRLHVVNSLKDTGLQLDPTDPLQDTGLQLSSDPNHLTAPKLQQLGPLALSVEDVEAILNDTELQS